MFDMLIYWKNKSKYVCDIKFEANEGMFTTRVIEYK